MNLSYRLNQLFWGGLDWLFPPVCGGCDRPGYLWCPECQHQVQTLPEPICEICGVPIDHPGKCGFCRDHILPYKEMRSWLVFEGPIRHALHGLKYRRNITLGNAIAKHLSSYVSGLGWHVDLVVPIPLGRERLKERGYNQTGLVARPLALIHRWQYTPGALIRSRETRTQVGLSAAERLVNVRGAFRAEPRMVAGRQVLLMDDVATTGATLAAGAQALIEGGASCVYGLTLARALARHGLATV